MAQTDFQYDPKPGSLIAAEDQAGLPLSVFIFADRERVRGELHDDASAAGFRIGRIGDMADLLDGEAEMIGDVVLLDCPSVDGPNGGAILAALSQLDLRAARTGAQLIVSTSMEALDDVFGCLDQADPVVLVDPTRGERVIALGDILTKMPAMRLRELSDTDRLTLLRQTEQVGRIAKQDFRAESAVTADMGKQAARSLRPALPDPRLVRQMIRQRQKRTSFFDGELFADPAWDILLDLTAARAEHERVSVTSLCIAAGVPPTTALRWIGQMVEQGLLERVSDDSDKRRAFIALTDKSADGMAHYFSVLSQEPELPA